MARKQSSRRGRGVVSQLAKSAVSLVRIARTRTSPRRGAAPRVTPARASAPPVPKRSIVRKPPRRPTVRASTKKTVRRTPRAARPLVIPAAESPRGQGLSPSVAAPRSSAPAILVPAPGAPATGTEEAFALPNGYGDDRIVLLVKDPWWLFAYWEIQPETERAARGQLAPQDISGLQSVLRVYDVTDVNFPSQPAHHTFDIGLSGLATNWYIHTNAPNHAFLVEIGLLTAGGRFLPLARSNRVTAPRFGPSDLIDEDWMTTDETYWKLFGSVGVGVGSSQPGLLPAQLFSGNLSSNFLTASRPVTRGFWFRINTELVIHGATEPRATVVIQGQRAVVRKDGTFGLRVALPEGTQTVTIEITSSDGRQSRTLTPVVTMHGVASLAPGERKSAPQQPKPLTGPLDPGAAA